MGAPTLRSLARTLGISRTTISEALRHSPRVHPETAEKIRAAAEAAGYHRNPLAGAIMSELRRSRGDIFRGVLAVITLDEPDRPAYAKSFHAALFQGVHDRAVELGFRTERFEAGGRTLSLARLNRILQSRGIRGVVLLPAWRSPDLLQLDWKNYSGVYLDYHIDRPVLHCVCSDHFQSMMNALQRLRELGYRRPGVVLPRQHDERLSHRWEGAFLGFQQHYGSSDPVPPYVTDAPEQRGFTRWFREQQPDVVLSHLVHVMDWMRAAGAELPRTHGFFCLNLVHATEPCAGLDLTPRLIGAKGAELLIAQLYRNERGSPSHRSLTTLASTWVDGPTVRPQTPRRAKSAV
ncbi:MAG: LacI family transcriptional regulator [Candidatus Didemnitutus sp.]|nr:LacI family transcriptional regulator [Candidatus Didemnitutus sp.]